jgi:hypothetical protein
MPEKEYSSVDYVGQTLRKSIESYLGDKIGAEFSVEYGFNPNTDTSTISYSIEDLNIELSLTKKNKRSTNNFELSELIRKGNEQLNNEDENQETITPERSKIGRISGSYLKRFAKSKIQNLKRFISRD